MSSSEPGRSAAAPAETAWVSRVRADSLEKGPGDGQEGRHPWQRTQAARARNVVPGHGVALLSTRALCWRAVLIVSKPTQDAPLRSPDGQ